MPKSAGGNCMQNPPELPHKKYWGAWDLCCNLLEDCKALNTCIGAKNILEACLEY